MRVAGLILAAVAVTSAAMAQPPEAEPEARWTVVGMRGGAMGWEHAGIKTDEASSTKTVLRMMYFETPKPIGDDLYNYTMQEVTFLCGQNWFRFGEASVLDAAGEKLGAGKPDADWRELQPGTPDSLLEGVVCRGGAVARSKPYTDAESAMIGAIIMAQPE
jgi:hypothetical protein